MGSFSHWLFSFFLSTPGIIVLAALDASVLFSLPFALDAALVIMVARNREMALLYPLLVIPASLAGSAFTFWIGHKAGEEGLKRLVPRSRLERIEKRIRASGAFALASSGLIPPPFPFTPFVLASGALEVDRKVFFVTLAVARVIRFGLETVLAVRYGHALVRWLESDTVTTVAGVMFALVLVGVGVSAYRLLRSSKQRPARSVRA